jgi:trafficking protein particle complex subunit 6
MNNNNNWNESTNEQGTFVLHENNFRWLRHISAKSTDKEIQNYLLFPCGLIRGALTNLGLHNCVVSAEYPNFPGCIFTIKL